MTQFDQTEFNLTIGSLDRLLSILILYAKDPTLDLPNRQTLKHHAEDMEAAASSILKRLEKVEGTPQSQACKGKL